MQQTPIFLPPNFSGGEGMIMMIPAQQQAPRGPPKNWNQNCAKGVGIATIVVAVVAFVCNIGWFSLDDSLAYVGVGFWAGIPMFVSGLLLTIGGFRPKKSLIVAVLVMSIVANLLGIGFVAVGGAQMNQRRDSYYNGYSYYSYDSYYYADYSLNGDASPLFMPWLTTTTTTTPAILPSSIGMGTWFVILGLASFGLLLTASIMSCFSVCHDCGQKVSPYPTIAYIPQGMLRNPDGSIMSAMYPPVSMQAMQQPPAMSYGFMPQGATPPPPPAYSERAADTSTTASPAS